MDDELAKAIEVLGPVDGRHILVLRNWNDWPDEGISPGAQIVELLCEQATARGVEGNAAAFVPLVVELADEAMDFTVVGPVTERDVLVARGFAEEVLVELRAELARLADERGERPPAVATLNAFQSLELANEMRMNEAGWYRRDEA